MNSYEQLRYLTVFCASSPIESIQLIPDLLSEAIICVDVLTDLPFAL